MRDRAELEDIERDREESANYARDQAIVAEALEIAATEGDDRELIDKLLDQLTGGESYDQFVLLVDHILSTKDSDPVEVPFQFRELVQAAAVSHFWHLAENHVDALGDSSEYQ